MQSMEFRLNPRWLVSRETRAGVEVAQILPSIGIRSVSIRAVRGLEFPRNIVYLNGTAGSRT